jgi:Protein of unknown function (DUF2877)
MPSLEISAISITPTARAWLTDTHEAHVLHVFDRACNLINERREVLSLVSYEIGNGPFNLVLENDVLFSDHLNLETAISIHADQLQLGNLIINTTSAKLWSPRPDWVMLHTKREDILNQITSLPITSYLPSLPTHLLSTFSTSIIATDLATSVTTAKQLAGLGQGLTPAGDDFIMGAILAAWIIHPSNMARVLAEEITNTAALLTTSLSAAWLRSAGGGEAGILWHEFFDALITGKDIQLPITKVLSVGETSGADALAGFVSLFIYWGEHCSNLWEYNQT